MPDSPRKVCGRIIFGTMRLSDSGRSLPEQVGYLTALRKLGIGKLHSSDEYDTFPLLCAALGQSSSNFAHMVKLAEPSFNDGDRFDALRLRAKIDAYRTALGVETLDDVQWMWRHKLDDDEARIADFMSHQSALGAAFAAEKARGAVGRVLCFPYSVAFAEAALELPWIDGLAVYRNREERDYDRLIERASAIGKVAIIIRPLLGGKLARGEASPAHLVAEALDLPGVESAVVSSNRLDRLAAFVA